MNSANEAEIAELVHAYEVAQKLSWPATVPQHLTTPNETLWTGYERLARSRPDELGLDFLGRIWTWGQLVAISTELAAGLHHRGVRSGDRVILLAQNSPQFVTAFFAVMRLGAVVVPVNPMNKALELAHYLQDSGAVAAFVASDLAGELLQAHGSTLAEPKSSQLHTVVTFDWLDVVPQDPALMASLPEAWQTWMGQRYSVDPDALTAAGFLLSWDDLLKLGDVASLPPVPCDAQALALLPYTSGTTGLPKGCQHTHATLLPNALAGGPWIDLRPGDRQLIVVPMFHITGLVMGLLACVQHACQIVLLPRWDRRMAAKTIARVRVTHWPNIPTMVIDLLSGTDLANFDLSSLRYIGGGGATMPEAVAQRLQSVYQLDYVEGYGLTETAAPTHLNPMTRARRHCLGIPFVGTKALVINPDTLAPMGFDQVGEIVVSGPQVFTGYWQQAKATQAAFVTIAGQRYFRTGDIGRMDAEGYFFIADRLKRMINASGFKVWPAEVEALLHAHPAIKESCVIAMRDAYRGESVKALVVLHEHARGTLSAEDLIAWAKANMAAYKYPRAIDLVDDLPRTATGKVLWRQAQANQDALGGCRTLGTSAANPPRRSIFARFFGP